MNHHCLISFRFFLWVGMFALSACGSKSKPDYSSSAASAAMSNTANLSSSSSLGVIGTLNDTGIARCASNEEAQLDCPQGEFPNQDGDIGRDALARSGRLEKQGGGLHGFDWTKLDSEGNALATQNAAWSDSGDEASGTRWTCVRDNVTGLLWEVKESDPGHPRYGEHAYTWFQSNPHLNGGNAGFEQSGADQCTTQPCNTEYYTAWINQQGLCGYRDWRVPSVNELLSIAVNSELMPALDTNYFPNANKPRFFTKHSLASDPTRAWYVYFTDASVSFTNKSDASHLRLVRGGFDNE